MRKRVITKSLYIIVLFFCLGSFSAWAAEANEQALKIELYHLTVTPQGSGLLVKEGIQVVNSAQKAVKAEGLFFNLPDGYSGLAASSGLDPTSYQVKDSKLVFTGEVPPGGLNLGFSYQISSSSPHFSLTKEFPFGASVLYVLVPPQGMIVDGLADQGQVDMGNGLQFKLYAAENLAAGASVPLRLTLDPSGASSSGGVSRSDSPAFHNPGHIRFWKESPFKGVNAHIFLVLLGVAVVGGLIYLIKQLQQAGRGEQEAVQGEEEAFQRLVSKEKSLLRKLAELEEGFARQEMAEDSYRELKEAYKKRLMLVKTRLRNFT